MTLVIRSRPFCKPKLQTAKPASTVIIIQQDISQGLARIASNTPSTAPPLSPEKVPAANLKK